MRLLKLQRAMSPKKIFQVFVLFFLITFFASCVTVPSADNSSEMNFLPGDASVYIVGNVDDYKKVLYEVARILGKDISSLKPIINRTGKIYCAITPEIPGDNLELSKYLSFDLIGLGNYKKSLIYSVLKKEEAWTFNKELDYFSLGDNSFDSSSVQFSITDQGRMVVSTGEIESILKQTTTSLPPNIFNEEIFFRMEKAEWMIIIADASIILESDSLSGLRSMPLTHGYLGLEKSQKLDSDNQNFLLYGKLFLSDPDKVRALATGLRFFFFSKSRLTGDEDLKSSFAQVKIGIEEQSVVFSIGLDRVDTELIQVLAGEGK